MQEVGEVLHLAKSGRVIVRLSQIIKEDQILCDKDGHKIAKVTELIGPVSNPYASGIPLSNNIKKFINSKIFALEQTQDPARKNRRYKKWKQ